MPQISGVIITLNEERNIERCILSIINVVDEIVVVDSFSTDRTEEICQKYNVRFIKQKFLGYIEQKNFALTQASNNYVLSLDADEALSEILKNSIINIKNNWNADGYYFNRLTNYCGKWIKHNSWYPDPKLRLFDKRKGLWEGTNPHDRYEMKPGTRVKYLKGDLLHYSYYAVSEHVAQTNKFSEILSHSFHKRSRNPSILAMLIHPFWRFIRDYFIKHGFLDGVYGLIVCINAAHEVFLKYAKHWVLVKNEQKLEPFRICFINSNNDWGGGEKWHLETATLLLQKGYSCFVLANKKSELYKRVRNTPLHYFQIRLSNLSFLNIFKIYKIYKVFKRERIKSIIINSSRDLKIAGIAAKLANVKNIVYRRGLALPVGNSIINRYLFKNVVTQVVANSEETKRTILAKNPKLFNANDIHVIYNGINIQKELDAQIVEHKIRENNEIIIGNVGRLVDQKGQDYLVEIAVLLKQKGINFKIVIVGEGKKETELRYLVRKANVTSNFMFVGFANNVINIVNQFDIFVLPSRYEGFGFAIVEAMVCKKPVVAFNISSNPEIIDDNKTGFLVNAFNVHHFANKIELLINNAQLRTTMGQAGFERVKNMFDINININKIEALLQ